MKKVETLADAKKRMAAKKYNGLVLKAFDDLEHDGKRTALEQRAVVEAAARERL